MQVKHTPGPWEVVITIDGITIPNWLIQIGKVKVPAFPYKRIYSEDRTQSGLVQDDEQAANIRLIAAAPELLEALKTCEAFLLSAGFASSDAYAEASAAIEKATGENT